MAPTSCSPWPVITASCVRCAGCDDLAAQWADADESAGGEFEVLGDAPVEADAAVQVIRRSIARRRQSRKTFVVEGLARIRRPGLPVAGRDVRTAYSAAPACRYWASLISMPGVGNPEFTGADVRTGDEIANGADSVMPMLVVITMRSPTSFSALA